MRRMTLGKIGLVGLLALPLLAPTCVEERVVDLVLGGMTTTAFEARGSVNAIDDAATHDLAAEVDLNAILSENGVSVDDIRSIRVSGISYRITSPDPNPAREVNGALVTLARDGGPVVNLVVGLDAPAGIGTDWIDVMDLLDSDGVDLLNGALADVLTAAQLGASPAVSITYSVTGASLPTGEETNFDWELGVSLHIVGGVAVDVPVF
ncbi:MAG: hypothetical protein QF819_06470 [Gemmatimonadota bacterium]|nr:hypothetical protein [Gemmatimonadota bacterium]MDP6802802.1 hypothetical protein [Gemmatimonadota bacterium]MDP7031238.1 hypothetical protein [Gemmatimonadota bacterium]